jgi:hypothetical protein
LLLTHQLTTTTMKRHRIRLGRAAIVLALMLPATASMVCAQSGSHEANDNEGKSAKRISFEGYFQGSEVDTLQGSPPDAISVDGSVFGIATHLGQFTLTYEVNVKLPEGSSIGSAELIAADGDRLFFSLVGQGDATNTDTPTLNTIVETNTVIGGTGRFSGAIGTFTTKRLVDLATGFTSGSVHGTILSPRSSRKDR